MGWTPCYIIIWPDSNASQESASDGVLSNESLGRGDDLRKMGAPGLRPAVILMKFEQLGNGASMRMTRSNERQALIELERIDHATWEARFHRVYLSSVNSWA